MEVDIRVVSRWARAAGSGMNVPSRPGNDSVSFDAYPNINP